MPLGASRVHTVHARGSRPKGPWLAGCQPDGPAKAGGATPRLRLQGKHCPHLPRGPPHQILRQMQGGGAGELGPHQPNLLGRPLVAMGATKPSCHCWPGGGEVSYIRRKLPRAAAEMPPRANPKRTTVSAPADSPADPQEPSRRLRRGPWRQRPSTHRDRP